MAHVCHKCVMTSLLPVEHRKSLKLQRERTERDKTQDVINRKLLPWNMNK